MHARSSPSPDKPIVVHVFGRTDVGRMREHNEDAFYLTGAARRVDDRSLRGRLAQQFVTERSSIGVPPPGKAELLFGFDIDRCLLTRTTGHGDPSPRHEVWRSP